MKGCSSYYSQEMDLPSIRKKTTVHLRQWLWVLLVFSPSCTYLKEAIGLGYQRPHVKVLDIKTKAISQSEVSLLVKIKVTNPNSFEIKLSRLKYDVKSVGLRIAHGEHQESVVIAADKAGIVELPITVDPQNALKLLAHILKSSDQLFALITAEADFTTPVGTMEVSFEDRKPIGMRP
jgi:LEA14-like dessication related protein